ncbi:MAG: hypothetical protein ACI3T9_01400 [Romboutsia timonensis]
MAVVSKGIKLSYKADGEVYSDLTDLQEIPDLGGESEAIEITTLDDAAHMYTDGILNYGDSLAFKFLYKKEQFTTLTGLEGSIGWKVTLPDSTSCSFTGTCSVKLNSVGVNNALTYTLSVKPDSEMVWA